MSLELFPGFTWVWSGRCMIPRDLWEAKALGKGLLRQSNAGQDFPGNFKAPSKAGQLHIQESLPDMETLPWGGWEKVKVGLGVGVVGSGAQSLVFFSMENLTLNLERLQSPHPQGPAPEGRWADPPSHASTSSFGSGTTL